ncbi:folate/biopterin family MFS transporter [Spirulina major]|uniref:folate/biopterin family MFS transporter n=1 Tax=Spirulina major TaxID=270636 RepID=UPI000A05049C|nr:folate/biopterin family MFS transporter [Spirulina major]
MVSSASSLDRFKQSLIKKVLFGNQPTPELIAILTVYFVQGILGLSRLAVSFFLKDELHLSPAQVAALGGVAALPWVIKPVFGFLSDGFPLFRYRRRPYLILSGILGMAAWLSLAMVVNSAIAATVAMLAASLSVAISDVIADSVVVERVRHQTNSEAGSLQSLSWGVSALGGLVTAYLSGWLLDAFSIQVVFYITATFPLLVSLVAWWIVEQPVASDRNHLALVREQGRNLWQAVRQKAIWLPTLFVFLWQATPSGESAFFFFMTNELGFEAEFLGRVRLVTSLASLVGIWMYQRFLRAVPFRVILGWSTVIAAGLGMTMLLLVTHANRALGIDDHWFSLGDSLILTVVGQITFMPVLVLSARLCPPGVEATLFALLMSVWNLSNLTSQELGALLTQVLGVTETNFDNLWLLVVLTNLSTLLPLPFLGWLPAGEPEPEAIAPPSPPPEPITTPPEPVLRS